MNVESVTEAMRVMRGRQITIYIKNSNECGVIFPYVEAVERVRYAFRNGMPVFIEPSNGYADITLG